MLLCSVPFVFISTAFGGVGMRMRPLNFMWFSYNSYVYEQLKVYLYL